MEKWIEIFKGRVPKDTYQTQVINGEKHGLIIRLLGNKHIVEIRFGIVLAIRMLDEGIVQNGIYTNEQLEKFKDHNFQNVIYEIHDGEFLKKISEISMKIVDAVDCRHYVLITENYNIDIIAQYEPAIEVRKKTL